eukprot:6199585-Pleurochrysis_carterae.AAC.3
MPCFKTDRITSPLIQKTDSQRSLTVCNSERLPLGLDHPAIHSPFLKPSAFQSSDFFTDVASKVINSA